MHDRFGWDKSAWATSPSGVATQTAVHSIGWAIVIWVVVFWRLGYPSLLDPHEAHYAQITREMLAAGQWLVPLLGVPLEVTFGRDAVVGTAGAGLRQQRRDRLVVVTTDGAATPLR